AGAAEAEDGALEAIERSRAWFGRDDAVGERGPEQIAAILSGHPSALRTGSEVEGEIKRRGPGHEDPRRAGRKRRGRGAPAGPAEGPAWRGRRRRSGGVAGGSWRRTDGWRA